MRRLNADTPSILGARLSFVTSPLSNIDLDLLGVRCQIRCEDEVAEELITLNFSEFLATSPAGKLSHPIDIRRAEGSPGWILESRLAPVVAHDTYELLYYVEKVITIDAQVQRKDLFFLHSGVLSYRGVAFLLVAASGSGKSTTTWALSNRGFGYLSDELAPIDLESFEVQPYPHALCLKAHPPAPFDVPTETIATSHTFHIPTKFIPDVVRHPVPLKAVFFNRFDRMASVPRVRSIGRGEASALLYPHALNPLAHHREGLQGVATISAGVQAYALTTCDLELTCELVRSTVDQLL